MAIPFTGEPSFLQVKEVDIMRKRYSVAIPFSGVPSFLPEKYNLEIIRNGVAIPFSGVPSFLHHSCAVIGISYIIVAIPFSGVPSFLPN